MASWSEFAAQAPDFAKAIEARFGAHFHAVQGDELVIDSLRDGGAPCPTRRQ